MALPGHPPPPSDLELHSWVAPGGPHWPSRESIENQRDCVSLAKGPKPPVSGEESSEALGRGRWLPIHPWIPQPYIPGTAPPLGILGPWDPGLQVDSRPWGRYQCHQRGVLDRVSPS